MGETMAKRRRSPSPANPLELIRQLHEQLKQCPRLPPPWDAYQTDNPFGHHNLLKRLEEGLHIPGFGPSRHFVHRGNPLQPTEFFPDRCWAIQVMPSFHNWGLFAVFESRSLVRCAFVCKGTSPDKPDLEYIVADLFRNVEGWSDPVLAILNQGALVPMPDRSHPEGELSMTLDGISYLLRVQTSDISAVLQFSNPKGERYRGLARAAYTLADEVAEEIKNPQISSFLRTWRDYSRG